ncbi:MAG TPA: helix-turn-helix domain-containing protein [Stellaceae bacterium]|jgi:hypothetical protein|nr:helix-turn-helix domain-containing protein [Stellaceae bacterium]
MSPSVGGSGGIAGGPVLPRAKAWLRPRREKVFQNHETRVPLDREAKVRITRLAEALSRKTEPGKHYGVLTGKFVQVLRALLWRIHDGRSGQCNPSGETIADKAGCCVNTVWAAIKALEACGILSWVNRIHRIRVRERDLFGHWVTSWRVVRTSNAYTFRDPKVAAHPAEASKTKLWAGPLDTSLKKETGHVGAPIFRVGETADALLMRHGWFHSGGKGVQRA